MEFSRLSKTSDCYGRYYTSDLIASLLVNAMSDSSPNLVIDLGAGDGALVGEASRHWDNARFVTVDIDLNARSSSLHKSKKSKFTHHHYVVDALDHIIDKKIGVEFGTVDSALCNPPYIRPKWQKHFGGILEDAGMSHLMPKIKCAPAEVLFIAQNLRFLRKGGKLGLILPDGVIAGERFSGLRKILAGSHCLEKVIELPRRVFKNTDAKAHIVVLTKSKLALDKITIQRLESSGVLSEKIILNSEQASSRLDYSYLASRQRPDKRRSGVYFREVTQLITRGSYSSSTLKSCAHPVFHTTNFVAGETQAPREFLLKQGLEEEAEGVIARAGDILLARVGRNLEQKICMIEKGQLLISDCIILLRVNPAYRNKIFKFLTCDDGREAIRAASHGVGARFITTEAVLKLQL